MHKRILPKLADINYGEFILWLCRRRRRFRVTGISMQPTLNPGEEILIDPQAFQKRSPQINDLVVASHPQQPDLEIVKRVSKIAKSDTGDRFFLLGDNLNHSSDSRSFGLVTKKQIIGRVTTRFGFKN